MMVSCHCKCHVPVSTYRWCTHHSDLANGRASASPHFKAQTSTCTISKLSSWERGLLSITKTYIHANEEKSAPPLNCSTREKQGRRELQARILCCMHACTCARKASMMMLAPTYLPKVAHRCETPNSKSASIHSPNPPPLPKAMHASSASAKHSFW